MSDPPLALLLENMAEGNYGGGVGGKKVQSFSFPLSKEQLLDHKKST